MYAHIEGVVSDKTENTLVLDVGGVGYEMLCTAAVLTQAPSSGERMKVYTWLNVRQDAVELFGFVSKEEKNMFFRLTSVSGIGPRTALGILGSMPLQSLSLAIMTGDIAVLSRAPGVGKKTAQRLALELKDKISAEDMEGQSLGSFEPSSDSAMGGAIGEAILALQSLGYTQAEAARAVDVIRKSDASLDKADEIVRRALRGMMKG